MAVIQFEAVHKVYPLGKTEVHALRGVSFQVEQGDFVSIAGPSGSGKSTILNLAGCIDTPSKGEVRIDGVGISSLSDRAITDLRQKTLGFIFQSFNLIPVLNVYENVEFPLLLSPSIPPKAERKAWIEEIISAVGLDRWISHKPAELSGGQRQRVAIARALASKPKIVLADEPTANLDSKTGQQILDLMKQMNAKWGTTFIFSTHDSTVVSLADHVIRLLDGEVVHNERRRREAGARL